MMTLTGEHINLRPLEPEDLDFIYNIENNEEFWEISATQTPYSKFLIKEYLENSHRDIYDVKQLRLVITSKTGRTLGLIDVFDFEPKHRRAALGILIVSKENRGKGYGAEALKLTCDYCFRHLQMHQVYANVSEGNKNSQQLFESQKFELIGIKKEWNLIDAGYENELMYQRINHVY